MKSIRQKFIEEKLLKNSLVEFLERELRNVWIANLDIQRSPIETRIYIEVLDPRRVLGSKSIKLQRLINKIKEEFKIPNPKINVVEITNQWLEPRIVAKRVARGIEMGRTARSIIYRSLKNILNAGAIGAEIIAKGKLGAKGAKARTIKISMGFIPKAGDPMKGLKFYHYPAVTKSGVVGITVKIAPPNIYLPDKVSLIESGGEEDVNEG